MPHTQTNPTGIDIGQLLLGHLFLPASATAGLADALGQAADALDSDTWFAGVEIEALTGRVAVRNDPARPPAVEVTVTSPPNPVALRSLAAWLAPDAARELADSLRRNVHVDTLEPV